MKEIIHPYYGEDLTSEQDAHMELIDLWNDCRKDGEDEEQFLKHVAHWIGKLKDENSEKFWKDIEERKGQKIELVL